MPGDHPDHVTVKRAASHMYKAIKAERKLAARAAELAHDRAIIERTATGSPMRIDDETAGIPLVSNAVGAFAGELLVARGCYICKQDFTLVDAFYHWLCPACAATSHAKRDRARPHRQAGAAHRRPRQDRDVHRAPAAPRRCAHDDHDPLPQGRRPPLLLVARRARVDRTGSRSSASTCATRRR